MVYMLKIEFQITDILDRLLLLFYCKKHFFSLAGLQLEEYLLQVKLNNMLFNTARINCLDWSPDSTFVATGSLDTCVIIYEIGKPASSRRTIKSAHLGGVYGLAFIDPSQIVSSGEDGCVRVWTLTSE